MESLGSIFLFFFSQRVQKLLHHADLHLSHVVPRIKSEWKLLGCLRVEAHDARLG